MIISLCMIYGFLLVTTKINVQSFIVLAHVSTVYRNDTSIKINNSVYLVKKAFECLFYCACAYHLRRRFAVYESKASRLFANFLYISIRVDIRPCCLTVRETSLLKFRMRVALLALGVILGIFVGQVSTAAAPAY